MPKRKRDDKEQAEPGLGAPAPKGRQTRSAGRSLAPKGAAAQPQPGRGAPSVDQPKVTLEAKPDNWYDELPVNHGT